MSYPGRNNSKISNRPSGGGNKKQGLAPKATFFFKAPFTGNQYSINSGDGRDRFRLVCMNQLGGIGRGRSQFGPSADGPHCIIDNNNLEIINNNNLEIINNWLKNIGFDTSIYKLIISGLNENYNTDLINSDNWAAAYIVNNIITHLPTGGNSAIINNNSYNIPNDVQKAIKNINDNIPVFINIEGNQQNLGQHVVSIINNTGYIMDNGHMGTSINVTPINELKLLGWGKYIPSLKLTAYVSSVGTIILDKGLIHITTQTEFDNMIINLEARSYHDTQSSKDFPKTTYQKAVTKGSGYVQWSSNPDKSLTYTANAQVNTIFQPVTYILSAGTYNLSNKKLYLSYYTSIIGIGALDANNHSTTIINGPGYILSANVNNNSSAQNVFWRNLENISLNSNVNISWISGQQCPLRYINIQSNNLYLDRPGNTGNLFYNSSYPQGGCGGFISDCNITGTISDTKGQQYCFKNTRFGYFDGTYAGQRSGQMNFVFYNSDSYANQLASSSFVNNSTNIAWANKESQNGQVVLIESSDYNNFKKSPSNDYAKPLWRDIYSASPTKITNVNSVSWVANTTYYLEPGTYLLNSEWNINVNGVTIIGLGYPIIKCMTANMNGIVVSGDQCIFASFIIDSPPFQASPTNNLIECTGTNNEFYDITLRTLGYTDFDTGTAINNMVYIDGESNYFENIWAWRGDHFGKDIILPNAGVKSALGWPNSEFSFGSNVANNGFVVTENASNCKCLALFIEHQTLYPIKWLGNNGQVIMSQGESPYSEQTINAYYTIGNDGYQFPSFTHTYIGGGIYNIFGSTYNYIQFYGSSASNSGWDNQGCAIALTPHNDGIVNGNDYNNITIKQCFIGSWAGNATLGSSNRTNPYYTAVLNIGANGNSTAWPSWQTSILPGAGGVNNNQAFYLSNINTYINDGTYTNA
jgi:hypothetical protein